MTKTKHNQILQTFAATFTNAPFSVCWKDVDGIFAGCNHKFIAENHNVKSAAEIIGLSNAEFAKKLGWANRMILKMNSSDHEVLTTGKTISYEDRFKRKNLFISLLIMKWPIKDHKGKIIGIACSPIDISKVAADKFALETAKKQTELNTNFLKILSKTVIGKSITQRKSFEDAARYLISFLENLIMNASDRVFWKDRDSVYLGGNKKVLDILGVASQSQLVGLTDFDFEKKFNWPKGLAKSFRDDDQQVMQSGKPKVFEEKYKQIDGSEVTVLTTKSPIKDEKGKVIGLIAVSTDISDRKKQEQELKEAKERAEKSNRAKSEFLAVVSHELRTPLNGIMGTAQILRTRNLTSEQQEYVDDIYQSSNILLSLINDILDLSKLEEGRLDFTFIPFNLKELTYKIGASLKVLAEEKGLKFAIQYPENIPTNIISDPRRIRQIIFNLVGNAIKYTKKGCITIKVDCPEKTVKKAKFKISVKDTGIGIPKNKLQFIFDRFTQLESAYKTKTSGAGLGLAIVKQIVESMHGRIHVKSKPNQGSTFWCEFEFPLRHEKTRKKTKPPNKHLGKNTSAKKFKLKALLVEDNIINQKIAKIMLQDLGCKVYLVDNGKTALKAANKKYDVIFMDIGLPDMDGCDVTTAILQGNSKNKDTPVIAMTAHAYKKDRQRCIDAGMKTVLTKPISYEQLEKTLDDLV